MFLSYIPNISKALHSTIFEDQINRRNPSTFCGVLNILAFVSSLYHLLLLGLQRIYAVTYPLDYRNRTMKPVYASIGVAWLIALAVAFVPSKHSNVSA